MIKALLAAALMLIPGCAIYDPIRPVEAYQLSMCGGVYGIIVSNGGGAMRLYSVENYKEYLRVEAQIKVTKTINLVPPSGCPLAI